MVVKIIDKQAKRTYQYINQSTPNLNYVESSCRRVYIPINKTDCQIQYVVQRTREREREREKIPSSMDMVVCHYNIFSCVMGSFFWPLSLRLQYPW